MPEEIRQIELLNGSTVRVRFVWLSAANGGAPYYPQAVRAWPKERAEKLRREYDAMAPIYAARLAGMVQNDPAFIFAPRSRYPFAATYRDAYKKDADALDISERFRKVDVCVVAGEDDTTAEDVYRSLAYEAAGDEAKIATIVMFDDVVAGMKTAIASLSRLVEAGMPADADITVASLLRVNAATPPKA